MPAIYTHKTTGWTRTATADGSMRWIVRPCFINPQTGHFWRTPEQDAGAEDRIVRFLSAHSWANDPNDSKDRQDEDRIVLLDGEPLPAWCIEWLEKANRKSCANGRAALQAAIDDADNAPFRDTGW